MKKLAFISMLMLFVTGCATTIPMRTSLGRAGADVAVTLLMDAGSVTEKQLIGEDGNSGLLAEIERELATQAYVSVYKVELVHLLSIVPGGRLLVRAILRGCSSATGKLDEYKYPIGQAIYQAKYAAKEYKNNPKRK